MARKPSVQVRVHPHLAKLLKSTARTATRTLERPVGIPEITRHLAAYLVAQGPDGPFGPAWSVSPPLILPGEGTP